MVAMYKTVISLIVASILFMLVMIFVIVGSVYPFEPYRFYGYDIRSSEVCPGDSVELWVEREIESGPYIIGDLEGAAYMLDVETQHKHASFPVDESMVPQDREWQSSVVDRVAPVKQGEYTVAGDYELTGWMFGFIPRTQFNIHNRSDETLTVRHPLDEECLA